MGFIHYFCLATLMLSAMKSSAQSGTKDQADQHDNILEVQFDSLMAKKYGADDYGMKKYVMAFLKRGPNRDLDSAAAMELQMAHLENIAKMAEAGKLALAGPFFGDGDLRGIYIFNVESIAEAEALTNTDPAIQQGSLEMELLEWYCSAALMAVNDIHRKLSRKNVTE